MPLLYSDTAMHHLIPLSGMLLLRYEMTFVEQVFISVTQAVVAVVNDRQSVRADHCNVPQSSRE